MMIEEGNSTLSTLFTAHTKNFSVSVSMYDVSKSVPNNQSITVKPAV